MYKDEKFLNRYIEIFPAVTPAFIFSCLAIIFHLQDELNQNVSGNKEKHADLTYYLNSIEIEKTY